jgi:hypothetical protein
MGVLHSALLGMMKLNEILYKLWVFFRGFDLCVLEGAADSL